MKTSYNFRVIHRYLGFFLAGIMAVYAISGVVLIYRDTNTFKKETKHEVTVKPRLEDEEELGKALEIRRLSIDKIEGDVIYFEGGSYNSATGKASFVTYEYPETMKRLLNLHKADTDDPLYYLNIFFGLSLLFFVLSSFWMFLPSTDTFKKGMLFTLGGIALTLILLFI